jgi:hypothetical protein
MLEGRPTRIVCTDLKSTLLVCTAVGIVCTDLGSIILVCRAMRMVCAVYNINTYNLAFVKNIKVKNSFVILYIYTYHKLRHFLVTVFLLQDTRYCFVYADF